jgi:hypothetical protein
MKNLIKQIIKEEMGSGGDNDSMVIYYDDVDMWQPTNSYNQFLFFSGISDYPKSNTTKIVLVSNKNHQSTPLDGSMVKISKGKGGKGDRLRVLITNQNRAQLEPIIPREYSFDKVINDKSLWGKGKKWIWMVSEAITKSIEEVYKGKDYGVGHRWGKNPDVEDGMTGVLNFEVAAGSTSWSILNFFNTNPVVRSILIKEYEDYLEREGKLVDFNIDEFVDFIRFEKDYLFNPNSEILKKLAKANHMTWGFGRSNEDAASKYLKTIFKDGYTITDGGQPGTRADVLSGVDLVVTKDGTNKQATYQAKPLDSWQLSPKGGYIIKSSELKKYDPTTVDWYIFGPNKSSFGDNQKGEFLIFKNKGQRPMNSTTIHFKYEPFGNK